MIGPDTSVDFKDKGAFFVLLAFWLSSFLGFAGLTIYSLEPGAVAKFSPDWPADARIPIKQDLATLMVFLHPQCPCSKATISELVDVLPQRVQTVMPGSLQLYAVLWTPHERPREWNEKNALSLVSLPQAHKVIDMDGIETAKFGVKTSGTILLYSKHGELLFRGGITESRGHVGENSNAQTLRNQIALALDGGSHDSQAKLDAVKHGAVCPVYGCSMENGVKQ